ncbi:hypothetical protein EHI8A_054620 [Entamoeba histolytica HM-1:IMSS-B]|uniref:Nucleoside transporter n=6 Tax=Entamoeba histolytica TaxID=5759 RepID=C4M6Z1_ENTH1|nr:hypothetical protein EHI_056410 [Entamoeba histolytica HM-1:IMSS]EMD43623.1 Hypothetical protein EHI5A_016030 [Entamoeba histolytica KU27]EMH73178.1 hypothetical protein EHI8A_054620 [Entamoeba histolytica HM-1:IMSS-B]EMS10699.1 hypothetical protein KM1_061310 [Entamoeba histolytica HM-3:IMSS]ENY60131.1 hypothetical protein EHI7A_053810 [Entamoeba histolytica HM-1:IMSS-A]GAT97272.1 hypothetical protein CL6EHI_056410 [Entamoeba histolytica]|eukprot:XP_650731.1 hypothetical protein EHI_056410 [Entamoeba histolytica HM-1:IMSS]
MEESTSNNKDVGLFQGSSQFTLIQNVITEIMCFLVGISFNYLSEVLYSTTNDMGTLMGDISFIYSLPLTISFSNIITVISLILFTSAFQKYPLFLLAVISLIGQIIISIGITPSLPLIYEAHASYSTPTEITVLTICALAHGIFSAFNFASFLHISSLLSHFHLILYIVGMNTGPMLSSFLDYFGYFVGGWKSNMDYVSMMLVLILIEIGSLCLMIFCYCYIKPFRKVIKIEPTSLVVKNGVVLTQWHKMKILLTSSFDEMKEVVVNLKYQVTSLLMVYLTSNILYPGMFIYYHISASNQLDKNNDNYTFLMKNISIIYTGSCVIGSLFTFLPSHISKKTLLAASVFRLFVITTLTSLISQGGMVVVKQYGSQSTSLIVNKVHLLLFVLMSLSSAIIGITQGYITSICFISMIKRAEERVATYVMLLSVSLISFIGTVIQIILVLSFSSLFDF